MRTPSGLVEGSVADHESLGFLKGVTDPVIIRSQLINTLMQPGHNLVRSLKNPTDNLVKALQFRVKDEPEAIPAEEAAAPAESEAEATASA
jgi:hypothetical protein